MSEYERFDANKRMHVYLAEKALGRKLRNKEQVHHVDGNGRNNCPDNLVICPDRNYHMTLHRRTESLNELGSPNGFKCTHCGRYDFEENLTFITVKSPRGNLRLRYYHKECHNNYHRRVRQSKRK